MCERERKRKRDSKRVCLCFEINRMSGTAVGATDDDINGVRQTDSMSNLSDMSGNTAILTNRFRMDVACVIDTLQTENLPHRKCAFDELKQACSSVNANLQQIQARFQISQIHISTQN